MKYLIAFLIFTLFNICVVNGQTKIGIEASFGINKPLEVGSFINLNIEKTNVVHSWAIGAEISTGVLKSKYFVNTGLFFLYQPIAYTRRDEWFTNVGSFNVGIDAFYIKRNFYFASVPFYITRKYNNGLGIIYGVNLKCFLFPEPSTIYFTRHYKINRVNWGVLFGFNYDFNKNLSISLKTDIEYPSFIEQTNSSRRAFLSNFNTMISLKYTFNCKHE
ncbi:MAG: hypothetical protein PHW82_04055 [Bacteroidales bacterium]|nr:hypothetical protein [Bacteroidales bacterium]